MILARYGPGGRSHRCGEEGAKKKKNTGCVPPSGVLDAAIGCRLNSIVWVPVWVETAGSNTGGDCRTPIEVPG